MQPVIEQATHALQHGRFEIAKTLVTSTLEDTTPPDVRLPLLEVLAQAQTGLHDRAAAAQAWLQAYQQAQAPAEKARLFEQTRQAYQEQQDYQALLHLAQEHLQHVQTPQERAGCMLVAGEALSHLQQYREARQRYLDPALALPGLEPETRLHLWHYLGLSHLSEHTFTEAAEAFHQAADLALGQHFTGASSQQAAARTQLHHLRNAAHFYDGVIHLVYQRPQQAVQAFQALQRPLTAVGTLNGALFLALAYRWLQQPELATRALQPFARTSTGTDTLRGPAEVVRAGIANLGATTVEVGEHLEAALEATLAPRTSWEPSWRGLLLQELGLALHRAGCRTAAIVCYEEALQEVARRSEAWPDTARSEQLQNGGLLAALEPLPLHTWSAVLQGEMLRLLQALAWLYDPGQDGTRSDAALTLALRLATTPMQRGAVWFQRAWLRTTTALTQSEGPAPTLSTTAEILEGLQTATEDCVQTALEAPLQGMAALLQGQPAEAYTSFAALPALPDMPEVRTLCLAGWVWSQAQQGTLPQELSQFSAANPPPWQTSFSLARVCETLLAWTGDTAVAVAAWLSPLLTQQPTATLTALHLLCRPGYLPEASRVTLLTALVHLSHEPAHAAVADRLIALRGGTELVDRIDGLLGQLHAHLASGPEASTPGTRQRKKRPRRGTTPTEAPSAEMARVVDLINLLHDTSEVIGSTTLPDTIGHWLSRDASLSTQAPEVVSALLSVLRQCPTADGVIQTILDRVPLSRRQRQALEATVQTPQAAAGNVMLAWEGLRHWSLGRLLETLPGLPDAATPATERAARYWYTLAVILSRLALPDRAMACLRTCLQMQPEQPLAHYTLGQMLRAYHHLQDAVQHTLQAWQGLQSADLPAQVLHLEVLNQLLSLCGALQKYEQFPEWLQAFKHCCSELDVAMLNPSQQQRRREEEGEFALSQALYLASSASIATQATGTPDEQLGYLAQAIATGTPATQHFALHRQAEILARTQQYDAATEVYTTLLQRWPEDQKARLRLTLLTVLHHSTQEVTDLDQRLRDTLTMACAGISTLPATPTPDEALHWLQQAPAQDSHVADVVEVLTVYGSVALERQDVTTVIALLTPLYALAPTQRQAYYLAAAHYARSLEATSETERFDESEQALRYAQAALEGATPLPQAVTLLPQIQQQHQTLLSIRQQEETLTTYCEHVCSLFARYSVPFQEEVVNQAATAPWVELHELVDLDEENGDLVATVELRFNQNATGLEPRPSEQEVILYAQYQRDVQLLTKTHGMDALPWPHTPYEGQTAFELIFPDRLALNRDLLVVAFADLHALLRYARVLQQIIQTLPNPGPTAEAPAPDTLAAAARYITIVPLLRQRLRTLATTAPSKAVQRQINESQAALTVPSLGGRLRTLPAFADAYTYFQAIIETMRPHLDTPPSERSGGANEERQLRRPIQRKRRQRQPRISLEENNS